jgi:hypothetical protein
MQLGPYGVDRRPDDALLLFLERGRARPAPGLALPAFMLRGVG